MLAWILQCGIGIVIVVQSNKRTRHSFWEAVLEYDHDAKKARHRNAKHQPQCPFPSIVPLPGATNRKFDESVCEISEQEREHNHDGLEKGRDKPGRQWKVQQITLRCHQGENGPVPKIEGVADQPDKDGRLQG